MPGRQFQNIDEYITAFPGSIQSVLKKLRQVIHEADPEAVEAISYGMPMFRLGGNLVHFAAYKNHIGFYPAPSAIVAFEKYLAGYEISKGAVGFPVDKPLPYDLIERMVRFRVDDMKEKKG